jgi:hypothetical protein
MYGETASVKLMVPLLPTCNLVKLPPPNAMENGDVIEKI